MRRVCLLIVTISVSAFAADWNARAAADYLDRRQKEWLAWPAASASAGVACVSCHTGLGYLLARPALARTLGESSPTPYEKALKESLNGRIAKREPKELFPKVKEPHTSEEAGVESILAALFIGGEQAFDRMWGYQIRDGDAAGSWPWSQFALDPWETPDSAFFGTTLAAIAVANAPEEYRTRAAVRENASAMQRYLARHQDGQPLHNRLALLWASSRLPGLLTRDEQRKIAAEAWSRQQPDGGWTLESLGPFQKHPNAPASTGTNAYATAFAAFALSQSGVLPSDPKMGRALAWLRGRQNPENGYWDATSMNKVYPPDSMMSQFMRDAATAYASLALAGPEYSAKR